jgi:GT2 family glycosyltransferase
LTGFLQRRGGDYDARLHVDTGSGFDEAHVQPIATSAKGTVNEVVWLPTGARRLQVVLHGRPGAVDAGGWAVRPVGGLERRWRMLHRVLAAMWVHPPARRAQAGLTASQLVKSLRQAYDRASRLRAHAPAPAYADWIRRHDTLTPEDRRCIADQLDSWRDAPSFLVLLVGTDAGRRAATLASLRGQLFDAFECAPVDGPDALPSLNARLAASPSRWVIFLHAGDLLAASALYRLAVHARAHPGAVVLYGDEDCVDDDGTRHSPVFKPRWSLVHARATAFFGEAVALRAGALAAAGGIQPGDIVRGCYDAVLRTVETAADPRAGVQHVPGVLLHRRQGRAAGAEEADAWATDAVRRHLARQGVDAAVERTGAGCWRLRHALPPVVPKVSIIIPTRDALDLTRRCVDSLRALTRYADYDILLVDNQSRDPLAIEWMRREAAAKRVRLLSFDRPFNYSAINNMAVREADGELVCLLNNDTEVISSDWLEEMVGQIIQPGVEVVGAKLLYPDGTVQHAGDLVGVGGIANHAHIGIGAAEPGYAQRAVVAQELSAVTGACLLTRRSTYLRLGGLDERHLPVAFNDVDYCLRVRSAGAAVVWTPHAVLVHHESVSRGKDVSADQRRRARREAMYMRRRWRQEMKVDPYYHPSLSHARPDFSLSHAPLVERPWQA